MMTGRDVGGDVPSEMTAICAKRPPADWVLTLKRSAASNSWFATALD
jgi:hypothetical protein